MNNHPPNNVVLSIIIPVYNEEATILEILRRVNKQRIEGVIFEIIVIDDGSKDNSLTLLEKNQNLYAKLIKMPKNGGKGAAVMAGLFAASGDFVLFQDADLEYDPSDYPRMIKPILHYKADVVMGSRLIASEFTRVYYFWHRVGNRFLTAFFNILNNTTFTDIYSCYLLFRRSLVDPKALRTRGWEQQAEILSMAVANAKCIYEAPISYHGRTYDEGKKIRGYHALRILWTIFVRRLAR